MKLNLKCAIQKFTNLIQSYFKTMQIFLFVVRSHFYISIIFIACYHVLKVLKDPFEYFKLFWIKYLLMLSFSPYFISLSRFIHLLCKKTKTLTDLVGRIYQIESTLIINFILGCVLSVLQSSYIIIKIMFIRLIDY